MVSESRQVAPYAPVDNVLAVIRRLRERGLPETLSFGALQAIGIPGGNAPRTLAALRFLGLVGEEGQRTERMEQLGRATTEQYQDVLAQIVRDAYEPIFAIVDPAQHDEMAVHDAFRQYEPQAQRGRMVTLFLGLCREAGIMSGGPPERRRRTRQRQTETLRRQPRSQQPSVGDGQDGTDGDIPPPPAGPDYRLLSALIQRLPKDGQWTQTQRDRWLQAMAANVDLIVTVVDQEEDRE